MSSLQQDFIAQLDQFDRLPDSLLIVIFNKIKDVKSLGRCCVVTRRFQTLIPLVDHVLVRVDCVISDTYVPETSRIGPFSNIFRFLLGGFTKPFMALSQLLGPKRFLHSTSSISHGGVTHHSPTQVLKNFNEVRYLKIELPSGELGIDDGVMLKWRASFGSTLDHCVLLGASSMTYKESIVEAYEDDSGIIPESFYTNGGLKLRVVWTISSLIAASARHYLLQPIISEHGSVKNLVLTDCDGQGVLHMNKTQLDELRVKPLSASSASKRTLVPALSMRLWYAPYLELPNGVVLKGATLVAIRPSNESENKKEGSDLSWVSSAFEEPYGTAAKMLVKRRTYCLEMNSF